MITRSTRTLGTPARAALLLAGGIALGRLLNQAAATLSASPRHAIFPLTVAAPALWIGLGIVGLLTLCMSLPALKRASGLRERVLVVGITSTIDRLLAELRGRSPRYEVVGYVDDRSPCEECLSNELRMLGTSGTLPDLVAANHAETIVVAMEDRRGALPYDAILRCKLQGVNIEDWSTFYEKVTGKICLKNLRPSWLIFSDGFSRTRLTRLMKRLGDIGLSLLFLVAGMPVFLLVALAIRLDTRGPIFFRQERVGQGGRLFHVLKFRTMVADAERQTGPVWASEDDPRITRVGRWLRTSRLDEFPQIINVLRGEMSFVGPRPERPHFVDQLREQIPFYDYRHTVKPGITGWAQVRYRYGATREDAEEKLQYDLYYLKHLSFLFDVYIVLCTIRVVLFGSGAR